MLTLSELSPTHSDIAICLGGYPIPSPTSDTEPSGFAIRIALANTSETMLVKLPWNTETILKIKELKQILLQNPSFVCGITFENINIRSYRYTDSKSGKTNCGYTATATNILSIIP